MPSCRSDARCGASVFVGDTCAGHQVEPLSAETTDKLPGGIRVVSRIAVHHDVNVRIDKGEHAAHAVSLALLALVEHLCRCPMGDLGRAVRRVVVEIW